MALSTNAGYVIGSGRRWKRYVRRRALSTYTRTSSNRSADCGLGARRPPGKVDLGLGYERGGRVEKYRLLAEVKWSDHNTIAHSIWDAAKLISALVARADHSYLVGGWPMNVWAQAPAAALYAHGTVDFKAMMELPGEWPSLLKHSQGTPQRLPSRLRIRELVRITVPRRDVATNTIHDWEIRAVNVKPPPATGSGCPTATSAERFPNANTRAAATEANETGA